MLLNRIFAVTLAIVSLTLPSEAAKRSVHLFGETFVFNFSRDFAFTRRLEKGEPVRQTVTFANENRSIVVSASRYEAAKAEPVIGEDGFRSKAAAKDGSGILYANEETDGGRAGSHLMGFCMKDSCLYQMARAIDGKYWLDVLVLCDACKPAQADETRKLAETLYQQLKKF